MGYKSKVKAEHGVGPSSLFKRRYRERAGVRYRATPKDWIEPDLRLSLYNRDSWLCHLCSEPVDRDAHYNDDYAASLDHIIPRSKGGSDDPSNLRTAHRICNSMRQDAPLLVLEVD
ncbi:HNH endonuclease [Auritidibacter ignavus]|uniref:HNH endonuclease n=1 Tax=Auritidibacter ignavus TaxID=678932 RepID=UPI003CC5DB99